MFVSVVLLSGNVRIGVAYIISNSGTEDYAYNLLSKWIYCSTNTWFPT